MYLANELKTVENAVNNIEQKSLPAIEEELHYGKIQASLHKLIDGKPNMDYLSKDEASQLYNTLLQHAPNFFMQFEQPLFLTANRLLTSQSFHFAINSNNTGNGNQKENTQSTLNDSNIELQRTVQVIGRKNIVETAIKEIQSEAKKLDFTRFKNICRGYETILNYFPFVYNPRSIFNERVDEIDRTALTYLKNYCSNINYTNEIIPLYTVGDGNCLYNSIELLHTKSISVLELRLRNIIELTVNSTIYKQQYPHYETLFEKLEDYVMKEMVKNFYDSSPWDLVSLPSVVKCDIRLIYPNIGDTTAVDFISNLPLHFSHHLNTIFKPKQNVLSNGQITLLWSHKLLPKKQKTGTEWRPNHFVPVVKKCNSSIQIVPNILKTKEEPNELSKIKSYKVDPKLNNNTILQELVNFIKRILCQKNLLCPNHSILTELKKALSRLKLRKGMKRKAHRSSTSFWPTTIIRIKLETENFLNGELNGEILSLSNTISDENDVYHFVCVQHQVLSPSTWALDFLEIEELDELNFMDSVNVATSDDRNEITVSFPLSRIRVLYKNNAKPVESMLKLFIDTIEMQLTLDEQNRLDKKQLHCRITNRLSVIDVLSVQSQTKAQHITFSCPLKKHVDCPPFNTLLKIRQSLSKWIPLKTTEYGSYLNVNHAVVIFTTLYPNVLTHLSEPGWVDVGVEGQKTKSLIPLAYFRITKENRENLEQAIPNEFINIYQDIVVDVLHMMLRICDILLKYAIRAAIEVKPKSKKDPQITVQEAEDQLESALVPIRFSLENKKIVVTSTVTGPMHLKFTSTLPLDIIIQDKHKARKIMSLIKNFFNLLKRAKLDIKKSDETEFIEKLSKDARKWGIKYGILFGIDEVTPYVHVLSAHIGEFYKIFKNLNKFTMQGVEKLNDVMTQDYFRGSNKKGDYFTQMLRQRICELLLPLSARTLEEIRSQLDKTSRFNADSASSNDDAEEDDISLNLPAVLGLI
ncbi:unnamed protein product [Didymodactylos carnosus]|uniref:OTU domain-containing protein n=1 Tax=Didymodactylos carnosus TaxID=1234261 RepID=A0A814P0J8_9BILA|nr:unnamed protein product [Didymodactylos carnosus]CAF3864590.1 unnamed protein product [Didymodactylos carnosus]